MGNLLALTQRELKAFWYSPIAYAAGALFLFLQGFVFWLLLLVMNDPRVDPALSMAQFFFGGTFFYWFSALILAPLLTMRAFSEEKRTGSIELLLTAPVTDTQVVLAKFLGAWSAYALLWASTGVLFLLLRRYTAFDWAPVAAGYLGTWLLGGALIAVGVLASSLTRNQIIAALLTFVALLLLFSLGLLELFIKDPDTLKFLRQVSIMEHVAIFAKGIIDTRPIVLDLSVTAACLFFTVRVVGSPRWRA